MNEKEDLITIDFKVLFKILWKEKLLMGLITSFFVIIGTIYTFTVREEFVSEGKLLPEISGGSANSLGGLANLIGVGGFELGMKNNTDAIRPDLYPDILRSTPFFLKLFKESVVTKDNKTISFEEYYHQVIEKNKNIVEKELFSIKGVFTGIIITKKIDEIRIKELEERVIASIDKKSGIITISVKMPDPLVAALVAKFSINYLVEYVTDYRTEKARKELDFLAKKVSDSKGRYFNNQEKKAQYSDKFSAPTIRLQSSDIQRERIESEYRISSTFYNELLKKYEEAKLKLQQETPILKVYQPPVVPNIKSEPKKVILILLSSFVGGIISVLVIFIKRSFGFF